MRIHRKCYHCRKPIPDDENDFITIVGYVVPRGSQFVWGTIFLHMNCYLPFLFTLREG